MRVQWWVEVAIPVWWWTRADGVSLCRFLVLGVHCLDAPGFSVSLPIDAEWSPLRVWTQQAPLE